MTFEEWNEQLEKKYGLENSFHGAETWRKLAWDARQSEIDELKNIIEFIFDRCDKTLQYWEDYDELRARINRAR